MPFSSLVDSLMQDTLGVSLPLFATELAICATIVLLLLFRLLNLDQRIPGAVLALAGSIAGLGLAVMQHLQYSQEADLVGQSVEIFTGLLIYDQFTIYLRIFLMLFLVLVVYLTMLGGIPDREDAPDFYVLLLGSTLGMLLMASANHLLIVFLAIEMTSVPSYAMVGFLKGRRQSSEAALKYVVYGAGAAGVMLYGISLLSGLLGTANLPELAQALTALGGADSALDQPSLWTLSLAILMVLVGVAFKLSIVPFHFWCPDAFEGASAEVAGYLSVASKGAAFALLVRFCLAMTGSAVPAGDLQTVFVHLGFGIGIIAAISATFGNLAAYTQTNIKRMLAYSTIAHAGYMLMAVAALLVILGSPDAPDGGAQRTEHAIRAVSGLLYYLVVYLFMNLGAFAIVAIIRNQTFSEQIEDYSGLVRQSPALAVCMLACMFSLIGMPPLGGFVSKVMVFASVFKSTEYYWPMWFILSAGVLNTVFSLIYYVNVLNYMFFKPPREHLEPVNVPLASAYGRYALLVTLPVFLLGVMVNRIDDVAYSASASLKSFSVPVVANHDNADPPRQSVRSTPAIPAPVEAATPVSGG
ncbi:MAG: NADH-quinone oxidoreductase subunit N [Planctomycetales bacterium]|nr:NADH-quinone oxidoreductase subunit N [Planctomycetales bacterium]